MRATIATVAETAREWRSEDGRVVAFVSGTFADGSRWSRGTQPERAAERIAQMRALIGQEVELEAELRGERDGVREYRLLSWPGGEKASGTGRRGDPAMEQERMDRRTSLMQAVALLGTGAAVGEVLRVAEEMYAWLRETSGGRETSGARGGGEGTDGAGSGGRAAEREGEATAARPTDHEHVFVPARPGWVRCSECGIARRA